MDHGLATDPEHESVNACSTSRVAHRIEDDSWGFKSQMCELGKIKYAYCFSAGARHGTKIKQRIIFFKSSSDSGRSIRSSVRPEHVVPSSACRIYAWVATYSECDARRS